MENKNNYENIKVSLIIPVYNTEKYLRRCLDSVISQTHKNLEIILVNDGSKDNSLKICQEYKNNDDRIIVIDKENTGVSRTRNTGLDIASGEYICFSDSDDYLFDDYVEYLLMLAVENDADIALTTRMVTTFKPKVLNDHCSFSIKNNEEALIEILSYNVPIGVYCKMFKKNIISRVRFEENLSIGEGFNFNTDAFQIANKVVFGNKQVYYYRRDNEASATTNFSMKKWENGLYAIKMIDDKRLIRSSKVDTAMNYAWWHTNCDVFDFIYISNNMKTYKKQYNDCKKVIRKYWQSAFSLPISNREKIRAILNFLDPRIVAILLKIRMKKYIKR